MKKVLIANNVKIEAVKTDDSIYLCNRYDLFKFYEGNRFVVGCGFDDSKVSVQERIEAERKKLVVKHLFEAYSMERGGEKGTYLYDKNLPIIVACIDGSIYIVDGQNRLVVCKELNIPFYFRVLRNIETRAELLSYMKRINYTKTSWTKAQQIGSEARLGNKYAQFILDMENTYRIPIANIVYFTIGTWAHKTNIDFKVTPFDTGKATQIADTILLVANNVTEKNQKEVKKLIGDNRFTNFITKAYNDNVIDTVIKKSDKLRFVKIKGAKNLSAYAELFGLFMI